MTPSRMWRNLPIILVATVIVTVRLFAQTVEREVPGDPIRIDTGAVDGKVLGSGVRAYLGIPYAVPPTDGRRWRSPQPAIPWPGVLHADRFRPECMQARPAHDINHYFGEEAISEDCLYINVWSPPARAPKGSKYPVIVWIHGGGFVEGSPAMPFYHAEGLVKKGIVFVAPAYRLGAFGFLAHPDLGKESVTHSSGNYGLLDQIAALRWVQKNIALFGGDPANVAIMGQSAGSMSVSLLQASALAKGLFHRAVGLSASTFGDTLAPLPLTEAEKNGLALQSTLGAASIAEMRMVSADRILSAAPGGRPTVDGAVVAAQTRDVFASHQQTDVPIIVGFTIDEGFSPIVRAKSLETFRQAVGTAYGKNADTILGLYPANTDAEAAVAAKDLGRDATVSLQMNLWAQAQVQYGHAPVYAYVFSRANPWGVTFFDQSPSAAGAYHSGDLPYWLGSVAALKAARPSREWDEVDLALVDRMTSLLANFARTGNPNGVGNSVWPSYNAADETIVDFGNSIRVRPWPDIEKLRILRTLQGDSS